MNVIEHCCCGCIIVDWKEVESELSALSSPFKQLLSVILHRNDIKVSHVDSQDVSKVPGEFGKNMENNLH